MNPLFQALLDRATKPLTTIPSQIGDAASQALTQPSLDQSPTTARIKGFLGGAAEGAGNILSDMSSPASLLAMLMSGGGSAGTNALLGAGGSAANTLMGPKLPAEFQPVGGEEAYNALRNVPTEIEDPSYKALLRIMARNGVR